MEAARTAAALIVCALDGDGEGARALLAGTDRVDLERVCASLAAWIVGCAEDPGSLRAGLAERLQSL
jgi:hypothetical protein